VADNYQYYIKKQEQAPKILCACGCGEMIPSISRRGYPMKFKNGHASRGELHPNWKGGRYKHKGYWYIWKPEHHFADKKGYVLEHRLVYEEYYKVCLLPWIDIHHINEQRDDNRIENLQAIGTRSDHMKHHRPPIDMSNRFCLLCDSKTTLIRKDRNKPKWHRFENGHICEKCYMRNYDFIRSDRKR
jgi:hypothetical protein